MIARKILLATAALALMSTPAWALPGQAQSHQGNGNAPSTNNNSSTNSNNGGSNPGDSHRKGNGQGNHGKGHHGKSHKCMAHKVAYVASGALVSQTLTKNEDGTYSGEVVVEVSKTNHHAAGDKGKTVTYKVTDVHVTFGVEDVNKDGTVGLDDLAKGDQVKLIGKITSLVKKCSTTEFTAETTIRKIVFNPAAGSTEANSKG